MNQRSRATVLLIDDDLKFHKTLHLLLEPEFSICAASSGEEGLKKMALINPDLVLLDLKMPQMSGMEVLRRINRLDNRSSVIIFTAYGNVNSAIQAIKLGAVDYIEKPFEEWKLKQILRESFKRGRNFRAISSRRSIIGESPQVKEVWQLVEKYGPTDFSVLIYGETGTGKELFAKAVHEVSKRKRYDLVPIDCSAIPESLIESEIFGYERGAFTGADISKPGQLEWADKGTLFLDEIGNLPLSYQAKILRVIQEGQYVPLGAKKAKAIDIRVISATNVNLMEAIEVGTFRKDLYYRISGIRLEIPPLRERKGDIELLARHFIQKYRRPNRPPLEVSDAAMDVLLAYQWPGNVRELEQTIAATTILADQVVYPKHLPPNIRNVRRKSSDSISESQTDFNLRLNFSCDFRGPIDLKELKQKVATEAERLIIAEAKKRFSLNQTKLSKFLNIDPKTLRSKDRKP